MSDLQLPPLSDSVFIDDKSKLVTMPSWIVWFTQIAKLLSAAATGTNNATALTIAAGDLLQGASANTLAVLAKGVANSTLVMNSAGTLAKWTLLARCSTWITFNGTGTPSILASSNVTSITDNGTGDYTINFTTSFADAYYVSIGNAGKFDTTNDGNMYLQMGGYSGAFQSVSACRVRCIQPDDKTVRDSARIFCAFFR